MLKNEVALTEETEKQINTLEPGPILALNFFEGS